MASRDRAVSPMSSNPNQASTSFTPVTLTPTDPGQRFVADVALDLLLAEVVDVFHRDIVTISASGLASAVAQMTLAGGASVVTTVTGPGAARRPASGTATPPLALRNPQDLMELSENEREQAYYKLENMGYRVGMAYAERLTRDRPRFVDALDVVKFVCKEFWTAVFRKQVDNLKTNHKGVYVLTDNQFRWFLRMSAEGGMAETVKRASPYLAFPCGLLRGALSNLGLPSVVLAEIGALPACTFQIKMTTPK